MFHTLSKLRVDKMKHYIQSSIVHTQNRIQYIQREDETKSVTMLAPLVGAYIIICCTLCVDDDIGGGCKWFDRVVYIICEVLEDGI